jgi:ribokinase
MITVVGSSNTDFAIKVDRFPSSGETVLGRDFFISGGGKGANQAACIAKLGGEVNLVANIGQDHFGNKRIRDLGNMGVNTKFVKRDKLHPSGSAFIMVDKKGGNLIAVNPGSNSFLKLDDVLRRAEAIKRSRILLLQLEIPVDAAKAAIYMAKRFGELVILNPAPAQPLSKDILSKVDILVPNEVELSMLTGIKKSDDGFIKKSILLLKAGVGCVIITLGKKGALLVDGKRTKLFKAKKVRPVDTTCAGDAFCGALALGLDKGRSIEESIEFASCVAALTCTKFGAQCSLPTLKEVKEFF